MCGFGYLANNQQPTTVNQQPTIMKYLDAKDVFEELKSFEGRTTFKGEDIVIDYFVLLPKSMIKDLNVKTFLDTYQASTSFEIEGGHEDESYTLIGISMSEERYSNDVDYFMKMIVW